MTKFELAKYAGTRFYALTQRMGAKRGKIYHLTVYEVTDKGGCKYCYTVLGHSIVANRAQWAMLQDYTGGNYWSGRPVAADLTMDFMAAQNPKEV